MKNLATCKPSEFLKQTNKIRKSVANWLQVTNIMNIRKIFPKISEDASDDEKREAINNQMYVNLNSILDSMLDKHPDETLELIALMCFVEPNHVDDHTVEEYLVAFKELFTNKTVIDFFTSLVKLGRMDI